METGVGTQETKLSTEPLKLDGVNDSRPADDCLSDRRDIRDCTHERIVSTASSIGLDIRECTMSDAQRMQNTISEADRCDLGQTWRRNWRSELYATLLNSQSSYCIGRSGQDGCLLCGLRMDPDGYGQLWMIQTEGFLAVQSDEDRAFVKRWLVAANAVSKAYLDEVSFIYNFVPKSQTDTIRYLKQVGFTFYEREEPEIPSLLFGAGKGLSDASSQREFWKRHLGDLIP